MKLYTTRQRNLDHLNRMLTEVPRVWLKQIGRSYRMKKFDQLVTQQLETMDQLLFLQSEIERCQEIEGELIKLHEEAKLHSVQDEISEMKLKLKEIQLTFEAQTEDIIRTYKSEGACSTLA